MTGFWGWTHIFLEALYTEFMKKTIHAQVVAKALSFPDRIEIQYQPVDEWGRRTGQSFYKEGPYSWEKVKLKFWLDEAYASECEGYFSQGSAALILRARDLEGDWIEPGEPGYEEPRNVTYPNN